MMVAFLFHGDEILKPDSWPHSMLGEDGLGRVGETDRRFPSRCLRTHGYRNVGIELPSLTPKPVHERRRQYIQIVTGRPTPRSKLPPPLPALPPLGLLLLARVEGVEGAAAALGRDVDAALPFPQTDCPPSPAHTISVIESRRAPGAYSVHGVKGLGRRRQDATAARSIDFCRRAIDGAII